MHPAFYCCFDWHSLKIILVELNVLLEAISICFLISVLNICKAFFSNFNLFILGVAVEFWVFTVILIIIVYDVLNKL